MPVNTRSQRSREVDERPIHPDWFYRLSEARKFFGYGPTTLDAKIKSGEIPAPVALSDTGRACGWFGRVILEWQAERKAKAGVAAAAAAKPARKAG